MKRRNLSSLLFGFLMLISIASIETKTINVFAAEPDIVVEDDDNPDGVTLLGTGEDEGEEASTCGTGSSIVIIFH